MISGNETMAVETALSMKALYDQDFVLWASKTAELLKLKKFDEVDWENLIEEVECMGKSDRRAVESLLTQLIEHQFKLAYHKSERERERNVCNWVGEIASFRTQLGEWLETTTLSNHARDYFQKAYSNARKILIQAKTVTGDAIPVEPPFSLEQVLDGEWFPIDIDHYFDV
ncbi:DUF29 domain-containing protein [Microcystis aeruginosa]|nr:DUF29 domain-containing protein [Microcystis aeruginosa]UGS09489.1 DUF29 domain-containing protein [Microcystis aeruginosa FACHB-905 = DIANCHI905]CAO90617.1 unnamed protein product [Microcystis aeruginosa PCC 7806]